MHNGGQLRGRPLNPRYEDIVEAVIAEWRRLEGIAAAGYRFVELTAVRGWTEHVPLEAGAKTLGGRAR